METEGYPEIQRNREIQYNKIRSSPNERMAEEPEVVLIALPQVQVPPESLDEDSEEDLETVPRGSPLNPAASRQSSSAMRMQLAPGMSSDISRSLLDSG